jgi:hypothetical protein
MPRTEAEARIAAAGLGELTSSDEVYSFSFATDPSAPGYWGFYGLLIADADCILRESRLGYDN